MNSIFQSLQSMILIAWLPGIFYLWKREGFRRKSEWHILIKGLVVGVFLSFIWWFSYTLLFASAFNVSGSEIMKGAITLVTKSLKEVGDTNHRWSVMLFMISNYAFCYTCAYIRNNIQETGQPFAYQKRSVLDVELKRLKDKKLTPIITIRFKEGREITGKCLRYSLTEPREILLESLDRSISWIRLDEQVIEVKLNEMIKKQKREILAKIKRFFSYCLTKVTRGKNEVQPQNNEHRS
ncbi:hypothetical protein V6C32_10815 [Desulforamulus ruminis]|uniref:hypothetical protein n=1 Tax=Desulforamulus ruminis TaxID=1564 RepID=UPI002FD946AD